MRKFSSSTPFGVRLWGGVTFAKSVNDPNSSLIRILVALRDHPGLTKIDLISKALGRSDLLASGRTRGWRAVYFRGIVDAGFVTTKRTRLGFHYYLTHQGAMILYRLGLWAPDYN